ncbi:hypothetical protein IMCC3317_27850 [Kordia antarctica]|uniref:Uncharacterized protein n=1 Tax=Kordia antarctica TaxID=1218801 RepID=A0A7L4ZMH5_9FLAO|nr:hypothetical protein [Kordia antarctica]QHI37406.1 hypothetical protein IMCC3317_27850 [Kordia antarctica]
MKKQLKKLSLNKNVILNFTDIRGGRPGKTHYKRECEDQAPEPASDDGFTGYCSVIVC